MEHEEAWALHQDAARKQGPLALKNALELNLPKEIYLPENVLLLGKKTAGEVERIRNILIDRFGERLPKVLAIALHEYWFACCAGAAYIALCIENGAISDNEKMRKISIAKGYGEYEGLANVLSDGFADITPSVYRTEFIRKAMGEDLMDRESATYCMALKWFHEAESFQSAGVMNSAFDALYEANSCLTNIHHFSAWNEAYSMGKDAASESSAADARTALARKAAEVAHIETRALKDEVKIYWENNINPKKTNDDAASILLNVFPLKFRTLSSYVAEFKKTVC